jgi:hypothetical protein
MILHTMCLELVVLGELSHYRIQLRASYQLGRFVNQRHCCQQQQLLLQQVCQMAEDVPGKSLVKSSAKAMMATRDGCLAKVV